MTYQSIQLHGATLSSKADDSSARQEISHILWSPELRVHYLQESLITHYPDTLEPNPHIYFLLM